MQLQVLARNVTQVCGIARNECHKLSSLWRARICIVKNSCECHNRMECWHPACVVPRDVPRALRVRAASVRRPVASHLRSLVAVSARCCR